MENLVTIVEVRAYSERQYQKQDGTTRMRSTSQTCKRFKDNGFNGLDGLKND